MFGNVGNSPMKSEFGTQRPPSVSRLKGALLRTSSHLRWKRQGYCHHLAAQRELDSVPPRWTNLPFSLTNMSTVKGQCWKLLTNGKFSLCFQLPLLNSCLWFIGTVNLITGPLSYYEGHGKRKMAKWLLISNPTGTFSRCKQTGKKYV